ncbi:MAG: hypothetical protein BWX88_02763 [Planctomycetes bacterium ADurb.Bin126]|nr:MAG: hypothetical protein BWX88_02763 [Planctomycetes bacterium ADurb.Bin126]HOD79952.1 hypothetical protein [Phycisphaerae bacterium]HQL73233.1 hypothetical protein [Phycisphaerae bacterium]
MVADANRIYACLSLTKGGVAVNGVTHFRITPQHTFKRDSITKKAVVCHSEVMVEVYGNDPRALTLLLGSAAAAVVGTVLRDDNSQGTETLTNVQFVEVLTAAEVPEADQGGKLASFGIRGWCQGTAAVGTKWVSA